MKRIVIARFSLFHGKNARAYFSSLTEIFLTNVVSKSSEGCGKLKMDTKMCFHVDVCLSFAFHVCLSYQLKKTRNKHGLHVREKYDARKYAKGDCR